MLPGTRDRAEHDEQPNLVVTMNRNQVVTFKINHDH